MHHNAPGTLPCLKTGTSSKRISRTIDKSRQCGSHNNTNHQVVRERFSTGAMGSFVPSGLKPSPETTKTPPGFCCARAKNKDAASGAAKQSDAVPHRRPGPPQSGGTKASNSASSRAWRSMASSSSLRICRRSSGSRMEASSARSSWMVIAVGNRVAPVPPHRSPQAR